MANILIIGAGGVGQVVTHKCAQNPKLFTKICLASRTKEKCDRIADQLSIPIQTAQVDADDTAQTIALIESFQPELVVNVALPYQDLSIMEACLATGVDYLDTANYEPKDQARFCYKWQWDYQKRFYEAGIMALLGSGFDPGVTNVFTAWARMNHFDEIHELDIIDCNAGEHGQPFATNFNPEINIREVTADGRYYKQGEWIETAPLSISKTFDFPEGIGPRKIYLMYHEELESLTRHFPEIRQARFWMTFSDSYLTHLTVLENVGMTRIDPVTYQDRPIVPLQFLKALLPDPGSLGPLTKGRTCIGCLIKGIKDGKEKKYYIYNICQHEKAYQEVQSQAISYTTGVPAMIGAKMILTGAWRGKGVFNMEQFDPAPFMQALNQYGLPWTENRTLNIDLNRLPSPCFVIDKEALRENMSIFDVVRKKTDVKILLALKGFAMFSVFDVLRPHLAGVCASSPHEARLGYEKMGKEVHAFAAAYSQKDLEKFIEWSDHIVFNSFSQWQQFGSNFKEAFRSVSCGIRINPEHPEGNVPIYDPCAPGSRLGVTRTNFKSDLLEEIEGLHFHTLCEHNADALERTLVKVEEKFGEFIPKMKWINFGGGHHITRSDYDLELLCRLINEFKSRYDIKNIYIEPGEAIVFEAGYLVATVLDIIENDMPIAILDTSAATHMPDVLEMPYRPKIINAGDRDEKAYSYRLGGLSCLAGDIIGEYSFDHPLNREDRIVFTDMAHYSMVKTNTFNGIRLPSIAWYDHTVDGLCIVRNFGYEDYKNRLS